MEPSKYKDKDALTQKILDDVYRNALGNPIVSDSVPDKSSMKPNVLTFSGTDMYIKLPDGRLIKLTGSEVV